MDHRIDGDNPGDFLFDDCPVCQAQKKALEEGRDLTMEEFKAAAEESEKHGAITGGPLMAKGAEKISVLDKLFMRFWPAMFFRKEARKAGVNPWFLEQGQKLFSKSKNIDIFPLGPEGGRGFILVIDNHTSFWFYQDGDHFAYDGFEMGEYGNGDVTIFDEMTAKKSPWE